MDDRERDELLYRMDERLQHIDENLTKMNSRIGAVENTADDAYDLADKNNKHLGTIAKVAVGVGTFFTAVISAISAKLTGLL